MEFWATGRSKDESLLPYLKEKAVAYRRKMGENWSETELHQQFALVLPHVMGPTWAERRLFGFQSANFERSSITAVRAVNAALRGNMWAPRDTLCHIYDWLGLHNASASRMVARARRVLPESV